MPLMRVLTRDGVLDTDVASGSAEESTIGSYWNAVQGFLATGVESKLNAFVDVSVAGHRLETDPSWIEYWEESGDLDFEDVYRMR